MVAVVFLVTPIFAQEDVTPVAQDTTMVPAEQEMIQEDVIPVTQDTTMVPAEQEMIQEYKQACFKQLPFKTLV